MCIDPKKAVALICDGEQPRRDCQPQYYALFGVDEYRSLDLTDDRADYSLDLNRPIGRSEVPRGDGQAS